MGFWGFLVVCVLIGFTSAFLLVYGIGKLIIYMKWHHHLFHPNKAARVADASQLTTEELEATLRESEASRRPRTPSPRPRGSETSRRGRYLLG